MGFFVQLILPVDGIYSPKIIGAIGTRSILVLFRFFDFLSCIVQIKDKSRLYPYFLFTFANILLGVP